MMGKDVESMIKDIEKIQSACISAITNLSNATSYQLISREEHAGSAFGACSPKEIEVSANSGMAGVVSAMGALMTNYDKMCTMEKEHYVGSAEFNDSIGSPWYELKRLKNAVDAGKAYEASAAPLNYVGDKAGMLAMLNMILTVATDTKWAILYYHDYIQRGFDYMFNGNEPSITYTNGLEGKQTIGNIKHEYEENVHLPEESIDPY